MIKRNLDIREHLEKNKVLIIYGPRQVGKTTLVKLFLQEYGVPATPETTKDKKRTYIPGGLLPNNTEKKLPALLTYTYHTGDEQTFADNLASRDLNIIKNIIEDADLLVIDEAQKIPHIGTALKLIVDNIPNIYVIVTGSSAFDLANMTAEPLTGRKNTLKLYPISIQEMIQNKGRYETERKLEEILIYGTYPNIVEAQGYKRKAKRITEIKDSYLIKDILTFNKVKSSQIVMNLLTKLAFQVGSEVSTTELGRNLGIDGKTVRRYLDLLEKAFVIFRLGGLSRNLRKEITRMNKYYFYDNGIRNALISNFNGLNIRNDVGMLWENFMMVERMKRNEYAGLVTNYYFWRTYDQQEVDLVEERGGKLHGYEFKWNSNKLVRAPKDWLETYKEADFKVYTPKNFLDFCGVQDTKD